MNSHQQIIKKINEHALSNSPFFLLVDFEMENPLFFEINELEKEHISMVFPNFSNRAMEDYIPDIQIRKFPIEASVYKRQFDHVMKHLLYGNSFLTNLTSKTEIESETSLNLIIDSAKAPYKINFKNEWICFSPECFIKIINGTIYSFPMKGTIDAEIPNAEQKILEDEKEIAEHYTIVDLIRNDLSIVAENVRVEKFRYIDIIHSNHKTLLQVSSEIKGDLPSDFKNNLGEILFSLLPAGSISGAPKAKTIEIIAEAENEKRGFYTGVAFYFDGQNLDSCVLIRFIEKVGTKLFYRSGGGITINSEVEKEYQELLDKIYVPSF